MVPNAETIENSPWTPLWMLAAYVAASLIAMPITLLIVATAFVFGPWTTYMYAMTGSLLGGGLTFAIGRALGRQAVRQIAGERRAQIARLLALMDDRPRPPLILMGEPNEWILWGRPPRAPIEHLR